MGGRYKIAIYNAVNVYKKDEESVKRDLVVQVRVFLHGTQTAPSFFVEKQWDTEKEVKTLLLCLICFTAANAAATAL